MSDKHIVSGVNAQDYNNLSNFKSAIYKKICGTGSWIDDMKLEIIWREAHNKEMPEHLQPLIKED